MKLRPRSRNSISLAAVVNTLSSITMFEDSELHLVARKAVDIFASHGLVCCLFGSFACALYGCSRPPNDVDIVVMTGTHTQEELKQLLVRHPSSDFYLRPSRRIGATYTIAYCSLGEERFCKIDVLIPGVLNIPRVPSERITNIRDLPVLPFMALLLMKLQGWSDHRASARSDMWEKQYVDVRDINQMLGIAAVRDEDVNRETWLPPEFLDAARARVGRFIEKFRQGARWERIGFEVAVEDPSR
ncbi:hypothetical protein BXZ70DRAFT_799381 [Cristinia sonorae]|uniref:Uncharacterized protein n=1 Tax=Cristinia sonorae TaxID=1940300 RepID=A0A8K0UT43_9AGAR|nr:hypothetical protein BXZ70DRAFT_799381 [Cristinia sonorae]